VQSLPILLMDRERKTSLREDRIMRVVDKTIWATFDGVEYCIWLRMENGKAEVKYACPLYGDGDDYGEIVSLMNNDDTFIENLENAK
jgi:hypothetical protein